VKGRSDVTYLEVSSTDESFLGWRKRKRGVAQSKKAFVEGNSVAALSLDRLQFSVSASITLTDREGEMFTVPVDERFWVQKETKNQRK